MASILAVKGLERTSGAFQRALVDVAAQLGIDVDHLASVIAFETAFTFRSDVRSGGSPTGAVGLIQFTAGAARLVGTTKDRLAKMSPVAQLRGPVVTYFQKVAGKRKLETLSDVYMAVFAPIGMGKPPSFVLYRAPSPEYVANTKGPNNGLDPNRDGAITVGEAAAAVQRVYDAAGGRRLEVPGSLVGAAVVVCTIAGIGAALWAWLR